MNEWNLAMLTPEDLEALAQRGESETLEFKRSTGELESAMRTVSGFLNSGNGGSVLFGVANDGRLIGMEVSEQTLHDVANCVRQIEPEAGIRIETIPVDGTRSVVTLSVPSSTRVHTFRGVAYRRVGNMTERMPFEALERRLVEQAHRGYSWESMASGYILDDLDHDEIHRTVNEAVRRQRLSAPGTQDVDQLLLGLGLIENGELLNAAMVLFGRRDRLQFRFPQCMVKMARFRGITKTEFADSRQMAGNAFEIYRQAQQFWIDHLPVASRILPDVFEREDTPLYPPEALREALANAICHRDYAINGGAIDVAIYDDRMEFVSPGPLRFGLTTEELRRPHPSLKLNPRIANVFYLRGIIESWGRGTLRMITLTSQSGLPDPEFENASHWFTVRFRPSRYVAPTRVETDLTSLQQHILQVLGSGPTHALSEIRSALPPEISERTLQRNLSGLRDIGLVETESSGRWTRWRLRKTW